MGATEFFADFAELMKVNPPHSNDYPVLQQMERLGLVPGESFDLSKASPDIKSAFEAAPAAGLAKIEAYAPRASAFVNDWAMIMSQLAPTARIISNAHSSPSSVLGRMWLKMLFIRPQ